MLTKLDREKIIKSCKVKKSAKDVGSAAVQIALITSKMNYLNEHCKINKNDASSRRSLFNLVGRRRKFLRYLQKNNNQDYKVLIQDLGIRK